MLDKDKGVEMRHLYSEAEAKEILDAFPQTTLNELLFLAREAKRDFKSVDLGRDGPSLSEGWECALYGNCIIARYQDGEQERRRFFVPNIFIEFKFIPAIEVKKSILTRFEIGYCSCGKPIPLIQKLSWATDMIDRKGLLHFPDRVLGHTVRIAIILWTCVRPIHRYSLHFNRHPKCL